MRLTGSIFFFSLFGEARSAIKSWPGGRGEWVIVNQETVMSIGHGSKDIKAIEQGLGLAARRLLVITGGVGLALCMLAAGAAWWIWG